MTLTPDQRIASWADFEGETRFVRIMRSINAGLSDEAIAAEVDDYPSTIRVYRKALYGKLANLAQYERNERYTQVESQRLDILALASRGMSNGDIAKRMGISKNEAANAIHALRNAGAYIESGYRRKDKKE